jgi:hypothetical protein
MNIIYIRFNEIKLKLNYLYSYDYHFNLLIGKYYC